MRARIALLFVCALMPSLATAQASPASAEVVTLLHSNTPISVAWGAFEAGAFQMQDVVPALIAALETLPPGSQHERDYAAAALLDALIQIRPVPGVPPGPQAPAAVVAQYFDRWPIHTLVLLGRAGPAADQIALDLFRSLPRAKGEAAETPGEIWFALANLLVPRSPYGFAAMLLQRLRVELLVTVSEGGGVGIELGGGISHSDGIGQMPLGFPPHAIYRWEWATPGSSILSTGPQSLYYSRSITRAPQFPVSTTARLVPTDDSRLAYLRAIAGGSDLSELRGRMDLGVKWTNGAAFRSEVREKRRAVEREYAAVLARLVNQRRLSADEAAALPLQLRTTVKDERMDRRRPLPDVTRD